MKKVSKLSILIIVLTVIYLTSISIYLTSVFTGGSERTNNEIETAAILISDDFSSDNELLTLYSVTWENPLPQGNCLLGVWGSSPTDVFAVGMEGTILHYDGTTWEEMDSGTNAQLNDVWGTSPNDVFACGHENTILHYDGYEWRQMEGTSSWWLSSIWAHTPDDVYAVGDRILHYNGENWSDVTPENLGPASRGVWGFSSDNVYVVGDGGMIIHYDGNDWVYMSFSTVYEESKRRRNNLYCIWGNSPESIIAGGEIELFYDGNSWDQFTGTYNYGLRGIWGSSGENIFAAGSHYLMHFNGFKWEQEEYGGMNDLFGFSPSDVFAVGDYGTILYFNGYSWERVTGIITPSLAGIWGSTSSNMFAVGSGSYSTSSGDSGTKSSILQSDEGNWSSVLLSSNYDEKLRSIWGSSDSDVFAVGGEVLYCIECSPEKLGKSTIIHYDGESWHYQSIDTIGWLEDVWGFSSKDVYAVGHNGLILHYDGVSWQEMESGTEESLYGIWGSSPSEIFAVGHGGTILRYNGKRWTKISSRVKTPLYSIWGYDDSHIYISGYREILTYINGHWDRISNTGDIYCIFGSSPENIFAVGEWGKILYHDGINWIQTASGTRNNLTGIWINEDNEVFISGDGGTILRLSKP